MDFHSLLALNLLTFFSKATPIIFNYQISNLGSRLSNISHPSNDESKLSSVFLNNDDYDFGMDDAFLDCTPASCCNLFYSSSLYEGGFQPLFD